jgi:hypothetical protein
MTRADETEFPTAETRFLSQLTGAIGLFIGEFPPTLHDLASQLLGSIPATRHEFQAANGAAFPSRGDLWSPVSRINGGGRPQGSPLQGY